MKASVFSRSAILSASSRGSDVVPLNRYWPIRRGRRSFTRWVGPNVEPDEAHARRSAFSCCSISHTHSSHARAPKLQGSTVQGAQGNTRHRICRRKAP
jgi:hypothetical protein